MNSRSKFLVCLVLAGICGAVCNGNKILVNSKADALQFLTSFGHYRKDAQNTVLGSAIFDDFNFRQGLLSYQYLTGLKTTGELDDPTMEMMNRPRCAVPDNVGFGFFSKRRKRYAVENSKWNTLALTWSFINYTTHLSLSTNRNIVIKAFALWQGASSLTFTEVNQNANIRIRYATMNHGDGFPFDGRGGVLAHAFSPAGGGEAHFDDDEYWTEGTVSGTNLLQVTTHEIGHTLGLGHSDVQGAVMAPTYGGYHPQLTLNQDDINAIRFLYPSPQSIDTSQIRQTPTKAGLLTAGRTTPPRTVYNNPTTTLPDQATPSTARILPAIDICRGAIIDAIFVSYGNTYAILGNLYYIFDPNGVRPGYPRYISEMWPEVGSSVDTALTFDAVMDGTIQVEPPYLYLFKGDRYWKYINTNLFVSTALIRDGFPGIPDYLDASFIYSGDGKIYFIKGDQCYRYIRYQGKDPTFPKELTTYFPGIPNKVDAAFQWTNRRTYFFTGTQYLRFSDLTYRAESSYPRSTSDWWFGCSSNGFNMYPSNLEMPDENKTSKLQTEYNEGLDQFILVGVRDQNSAGKNSLNTTPITILLLLIYSIFVKLI